MYDATRELSRIGKCMETEGPSVVAGAWSQVGGPGGDCLMGMGSPFVGMTMFGARWQLQNIVTATES